MQTRIVKLVTRAQIAMNERERGASAVEYGLLVAGIAAVIVAAVFLLGRNVSSTFNSVADSVN